MPLIGGPLGISLAPQVRQSKTLYRYIKPLAEKYAQLAGYRQVGLRYEDLIEEEDHVVQTALNRLSKREAYDRVFRLRTAFQCSIVHRDLPVEQQLKPEEDTRFLSPLIEEAYNEVKERNAWDTASPAAKH